MNISRSSVAVDGVPRLLSINAYHYVRGGADVVYFEHAKLFEAHGWQNTFSSMHHSENLASVDSNFFAEEIDYHKPGGGLQKLVHAARVIWSTEARHKIAKLLDTVDVDIAHVHNIYHHQSPSILAELKSRGIPVVLTAHDLKLACPNNKMMNRTGICERCKGGHVWNVARFRCIQDSLPASTLIAAEAAVHKTFRLYERYLDRIVTPSRFYRDKLIEWGWDGAKIVHIPNFILQDNVKPAPAGGNYLLYFGRLASEKGLSTLIRASAASLVPVMLAGIGPEEAMLRALATELKAPVTFAGFRSGEALWQLVRDARAVVLPSEWYENGPMSTIEAFARGKPLVGANIGGIPELIANGTTGWSFTSGDVDDLAGALTRAWTATMSELREKGAFAHERAQTEFSSSTYYTRMSDLYATLIR